MTFAPYLEGSASIRTAGPEFLLSFRKRVEAGLLSGQPHPRAQYRVTRADPGVLHVSAADWWTAINVGLNEIDLNASEAGRLRYVIRYWRWAAFAIGLSASLAAVMSVFFLSMDLRTYIEEHPSGMIPGLSVDHHVLFAWAMVAFWGFVWPWLLIELHKRPLRRLIERLFAEVDVAPSRSLS